MPSSVRHHSRHPIVDSARRPRESCSIRNHVRFPGFSREQNAWLVQNQHHGKLVVTYVLYLVRYNTWIKVPACTRYISTNA
jgi:hypothetical protein